MTIRQLAVLAVLVGAAAATLTWAAVIILQGALALLDILTLALEGTL